MNTASDRRAPGATRIPFDGMVEVGGALGPSFEAQAVNLSEEGMQLRTAYLPEIGQPITCRFDAGQGLAVVAAGEVLWKEDMGDGGEFGIRFTNLDAQSTASLQRVMGMAEDGVMPRAPQGRKVRLHIEGLASPMRARLRGTDATCATAYSELGFLEMGKPLELEDASSGQRRPALIDRVDVEVEDGSRVPQLVVTLRYDDEEAHAAAAGGGSLAGVTVEDQTGRDGMPPAEMNEEEEEYEAAPPPPEPPVEAAAETRDEIDVDVESERLKGPIAVAASKITPAMTGFAKRAKATLTLLAAKAAKRRGGSGDDVEIPIRRTTAPAPGGGLHATGRKVVRGEVERPEEEPSKAKPKLVVTRKRAAVAGAIGIASVLAIVALRKPDAPAPVVATTPVEAVAPSEPAAPAEPVPPPEDPLAAQAAEAPPARMIPTARLRSGRPAPFTNGSVGSHGNVIRIKMDGPIEVIQGASQPTGFTVVIPDRKSIDATGKLASKDPRIAALRVSNEDEGAELTVSFKDGVPPYAVRARNDVLELVLAKASANGERPAAAKATKPAKKKRRKKR